MIQQTVQGNEKLRLKSPSISEQEMSHQSALSFAQAAALCPNCGARLEGRKCKLFCPTPASGYLVTRSEW